VTYFTIRRRIFRIRVVITFFPRIQVIGEHVDHRAGTSSYASRPVMGKLFKEGAKGKEKKL